MQQQILLIDDSKSIHTLVTSLLSEEPVTIHSALDPQFGLIMAASIRPDLILLDVEMPGTSGFEACRKLKADPVTASIPVIFLTGCSATDQMVRGLEEGAMDYVTKPFKLSELLSRVRAGLRTSHLIRLLEEKALIDPLTGLGNRAMFDGRFKAEVALRIRLGSPLSCIVIDVDHLKSINNTYGHPFGDQVLIRIADALTTVCRAEDVACRREGNQFIILSPHTSAAAAALLAERIRDAVTKIPLSRQGESVPVTCSIGVAEAVGIFDRLMLERADLALYESKKRGRNCVSIDPLHLTPQIVAA